MVHPLLRGLHLLAALLLLCTSVDLHAHTKFKALKILKGHLKGDPIVGDGYGTSMKLNDRFVVIGAPNATVDVAEGAGVVYLYQQEEKKYIKLQTFTSDGGHDHLGQMQVDLHDNLLFLSAVGTPLGAIPNETIENQEFTGSVQVYKLNRRLGEGEQWWTLIQTIDTKTAGVEDLTEASLKALRNPKDVHKHQQGALFGHQLSYDPITHRLFVGAQYQENTDMDGNKLINSGAVYVFKFDTFHGKFKLEQKLINPEQPEENGTFGAHVKVCGHYALVSTSPVFNSPTCKKNGKVYLYHYEGKAWEWIQTLHGDQKSPSKVNGEEMGDSFGSSLAISKEWAVVGAGTERRNKESGLSGAIYFYKFKSGDVRKKLHRQAKAFSDDRTTEGTALHSISIRNKVVLVSDPLRKGPKGKRQGGALVFERAGKGWKQTGVIYDPFGKVNGFFGYSTSLDQEKAIVGPGAYGLLPWKHVFTPNLKFDKKGHENKVVVYKRD